jgi:hypothetical protein
MRERRAEAVIRGTVAEIEDGELLRRAINDCRYRAKGSGRIPLWSAVADRFSLGSTYATQLCCRFDFDPNEMIKSPVRR